MRDLSALVKAYDVRGIVPDQLDEELAYAFGAAFVRLLGAPTIVIAHDMRESSGPLSEAFAAGATSQGADVVEAGLASTDLLYFASGLLDVPGAMFTASHNPARYNGIKLCRAGAAPVGQDTGLAELRRMVEEGVPAGDGRPGRHQPARPAQRVLRLPARPGRPLRHPAPARRRGRRQRDGRPHRAPRPGGAAGRRRADVLRARRVVPEPRGEPDRAGQPGRPAGAGARDRGGLRARLRRRRRPLLRRRRARRDREPLDADRPDRRTASCSSTPAAP